jgi:hypothetical protein
MSQQFGTSSPMVLVAINGRFRDFIQESWELTHFIEGNPLYDADNRNCWIIYASIIRVFWNSGKEVPYEAKRLGCLMVY